MEFRGKKVLMKVADWIANLIIAGFILLVVWMLLLIFVYFSVTVPTGSMMPTVMPGDRIIVDKLSTGGRIYRIFDAAAGMEPEISRVPGWSRFGRNDIIVFNFPHMHSWDTIAMNYHRFYLKRAIAGPGDTLRISGFRYIVNSDTLGGYPSPAQFRCYFPDDSTARADTLRGYMADRADTVDRWTIRDFGPLVIPGRGLTMTLDARKAHRYRQPIEWETGRAVSWRGDSVWLGDSLVDSYTFTENYYFAAGDNAVGSLDSRYWGLVPEPYIVGRARFVWWSERDGRIRWNRFLKLLK